MKHSSFNRNIRVRKARQLGDPALINGFWYSPFWRLLRSKPKAAIAFLIRQMFKAHGAIMAYLFTAVKSTKPGILVSGLGLTIAGTTFLLVYNSSHVWGFFEALFSFERPDLSVWKHWDWDKVYLLTMVDVNSKLLVGYNIIFTSLSLFHTFRNWFGFGPKSLKHRGTSYLYLLCKKLLSRYVKVGEFFIHLLETLAVIGIGIYLICSGFDVWFSAFLTGISSHELVILLKDKAAELHHKPLIES